MDRRRKNLINIVAMTSMCIFSLFSVFSGAVAWFSSVQNVDNTGDQFAVHTNYGKLSSVTFHHLSSKTRDATSGDATSFIFNETASGTITYDWANAAATFVPTTEGDTSIVLTDYEPLDKEQPLLLIFHLDQAYDTSIDSISITAECEASGYLGEKKADATPKYPLQDASVVYKTVGETEYYWMSSVVQFYNLTFADDSITYQYALDQSYATANSLPLLSNNSSFVTANNETDACSFSASDTFYESAGSGNVKNVGIVIDYYPDAIEYIYSTFLGNTILEDTYDGLLHFWCDWTMEVL